ncbi:hypothetical protein JTE90_007492 [Oedothorax gibbosus]|uniref:Uncharacterized protein n=1 Tax=Oedothorax gibbosus TaxID=931172 RepID=A0AAV6TZA6_9ARAC|nr:hypothetical protein JTE90_007492 [Oedothorax gibbosus]
MKVTAAFESNQSDKEHIFQTIKAGCFGGGGTLFHIACESNFIKEPSKPRQQISHACKQSVYPLMGAIDQFVEQLFHLIFETGSQGMFFIVGREVGGGGRITPKLMVPLSTKASPTQPRHGYFLKI